MKIEFFVQPDKSVELEFAADYLEENPKQNGKFFDVYSIQKAKSGKGYMLHTSDFICWFYRKEPIMVQLLEALDYYVKTGSGFQIVAMLDKTEKKKFRLGLDEDREAKYVPLENTSFCLLNHTELEGTNKDRKDKTNPFLKKISPTLSPPLDLPATLQEDIPTLTRQKGGKG